MKQKKILHIYNIMNRGGAETFIMNVFRNIDHEQFHFDFLCQSKLIGNYDDEINFLGGNVFHFDNFNKRKPLKVIIDTYKFIKKNGPYDAIHVQSQFYSGIYCIAAFFGGVKKRIVHSHSASDGRPSTLLRKIYFLLMRLLIIIFATDKIACGEKAGNFLFGTKCRFKIIYNGINLDNYSNVASSKVVKLRKKFNIENQLVIGHIGRFEKVKNHAFFIKIAKELIHEKISFKFVLVGNGSYFNSFKSLVKDNNLENYFCFAGLQDETNIYNCLFDVFVMPSLYEGFPLSVIEALSCGTPCVLSDSITKEVNLIDNMCCFVSLDDDVSVWCKNIINQAKLNIDKSSCVSVLDKKGFSINKTVENICNVYLNK